MNRASSAGRGFRSCRRYFSAIGLLVLLSASVPLHAGEKSRQATITLLGTTDLHGNLYPFDYYSEQPANRGLAKIATLIKRVRAEQPNVLLVDSGDTIQGTPLAYYFARKDTSRPNPTIAAMNALRYDAMAIGNHEFNFGLDPMWKAKREARFPWLAANIGGTHRKGDAHFAPYIIKKIAGIRVGIVGFITPGVPRWEVPDHYRGYTFEPILDAARRVIPHVRKKVDVLVVIAHSGYERNPDRPAAGQPAEGDDTPIENSMVSLAEQFPMVDIILFGHTHQEVPEKFINGVLTVQARNWGQSLARADVALARGPGGKWRITSRKSTAIPVTDAVAPDPEITELARPYHQTVEAYLKTPLGTSDKPLDGSTARYEDHPFVDFIHTVQREAGQADVSLATMFLTSARVPAGTVTIRHVSSIYLYENTLYVVEMTGAQLREALEHSSSFFPQWPPREGERLRLPGYNADVADGVAYTVDLTQAPGQRIRDLRYKDAPVDPAQKLRVAINNYRHAGGGRYSTLREAPIVFQAGQEVRELMIEWMSRSKVLPTSADQNWKIVPREAVDAMIRESRPRERRPSAGP